MLNRQETDKMYVVWTDPLTIAVIEIYEWKDVHYDDCCYSNVI